MNTINLKAFVEPKTKADYIRLLDEALLAADYLTEQIARMDFILEENSIRAKVQAGELSATAPCDGMHNDWSQENKDKFTLALGQMFGWK